MGLVALAIATAAVIVLNGEPIDPSPPLAPDFTKTPQSGLISLPGVGVQARPSLPVLLDAFALVELVVLPPPAPSPVNGVQAVWKTPA